MRGAARLQAGAVLWAVQERRASVWAGRALLPLHLHAPGVAWASQARPWVDPQSKDRTDEGGQGGDPADPGREAAWWGQAQGWAVL